MLHERTATDRRPHVYLSSGLPDLFLVGIPVRNCRRCGFESPAVPRAARLARLVADRLLARPSRLRGDQLRYIRGLTGLDGKRLATLMGISAEHLSRIENGRAPLSETLDRLGRAVLATALGSRAAREILVEHPRNLTEEKDPKPLVFKAEGERWSVET